MKLRYAHAALRDLRSIERYTRAEWGDQQWERYDALLLSRLQMVLQEPGLGTNLGPRRPDLHRFRAGEHFLIYRLEVDRLVLTRVLSTRSDYFRRLPPRGS